MKTLELITGLLGNANIEYEITQNSDGSKTLTIYDDSYKAIVTFNQDGSFTEIEEIRYN